MIRPLNDRIVARPMAKQELTKGGIVIPDSAKEKPIEAEVIAVGPGRTKKDGSLLPIGLEVGQRVLFAKYSGTEVTFGGQAHLILQERDILAIVE